MKFVCYVLMFPLCSFSVLGQISNFMDDTPEAIRDSATVTKDWEILENLLKNLANEGVKKMLSMMMEQNLNISSSCMRDTIRFTAGIRNLKTWAIRFLDSSAKGIDGTITGTFTSFGAYDECIDTVAIDEHSGKHKGQGMFTGKYCIVHVKLHLPPKKKSYKTGEILEELTGIYKRGTVLSKLAEYAPFLYEQSFRLGLCVPSGCSVDDINQLLSKVADYTRLYIKVLKCQVKEEPKYTPIMIFVMTLYSFAGFMVLLGTLTEAYCYYCEKIPSSTSIRVLLAFSLPSNFRKLVDTSISSKFVTSLNGIRFISVTWVILGHWNMLILLLRSNDGMDYAISRGVQNFAFQVVLNGLLSTETFFFLGGFLVCYLATQHVVISKRKFSIKLYILHRLWRIIPMYLFVILYVFILELTISGPVANDFTKPQVEECKVSWWSKLLFIDNFLHPDQLCFAHTWYLSVDMQLYIGSLIILIPLLRWPKVGTTVAAVFLIGSMVTCAAVTYVNNLQPLLFISDTSTEHGFKFGRVVHYMPYTHAGSYIIGLLAGYFLAMNPDVKIPKVIQFLGWICAIISSTAVVYGPYEWTQGREATFWEMIFFSSCSRVAWALAIAWVVICCSTGHGGIVNYILSWKVWIPLGRLTYAAYLVHFALQESYLENRRVQIEPSITVVVWTFFGHVMATYGTAFACNMLVEAPFLSLEKLFLSQRDGKTPSKAENDVKSEMSMTEVVKEGGIPILKHNLNESKSITGVENGAFVNKF